MHILWSPLKLEESAGLFVAIILVDSGKDITGLLSSLRFEKSNTEIWSLLTPIPALSAHIILAPKVYHKDWGPNSKIDNAGCTALAFMARNLPVEYDGRYPGLNQIDRFILNVNGQRLIITLFSGEALPFFELIENDKNN
jgi:hypothetical protein